MEPAVLALARHQLMLMTHFSKSNILCQNFVLAQDAPIHALWIGLCGLGTAANSITSTISFGMNKVLSYLTSAHAHMRAHTRTHTHTNTCTVYVAKSLLLQQSLQGDLRPSMPDKS